MKADNLAKRRSDRVWLAAEACHIEEFVALVERTTHLADYPFASEVQKNILIYDSAAAFAAAQDPDQRKALLAEWVEAMTSGPGIVVFREAFADLAPLDAATSAFNAMISEERAAGVGGGDHFAKPGANDRVWNALEKLCLRDPETFAGYYANDILALISEAWLGPGYQMTSQVNCVNPGGASQSPHRDYHLGFQTPAIIERYPAHVHAFSPHLTLQGAVAHCDMPLESGPTLYLPYSQTYLSGYLATGLAEFKDYFAQHHVQLPLKKGDAAFFNPAVYHAAGHNRSTNIRRMANLLQVSSAYGRAMESVDRTKISAALYPVLRRLRSEGRANPSEVANAVAASAEGYSFPTNLDRDPPIGGLAPETQQALFQRALAGDWAPAAFADALQKQAAKKLT
jgi:ectoine hydroxylase-related dioxygenase (phytanoyl-CoA dioxygenase family)